MIRVRLEGAFVCQDLRCQKEAHGREPARLGAATWLDCANPDDDLAQATIIYYLLSIMYYVLFICVCF